MLKKFIVGSAVVAGFAALGLSTPAYAGEGWESNAAEQSGNVNVCGNRTIGDIFIPIIPLGPVTNSNNESTDCSFRVHQN
ncbi:hypothetical protein DP939_29425 [Spongiactinospora rosea]|uniref:Secreted protein n=1 Tax=Spongiactinospora rosea TaxID=2248750 RepID=A0A366LST5_9ACTN|nr:hypothetical protein [Spongiactinospora rosea]RBQ16449.1 hypothetical protein DP939_29425 [Spongiactinospora rosea]